jgi:hypothetical protein
MTGMTAHIERLHLSDSRVQEGHLLAERLVLVTTERRKAKRNIKLRKTRVEWAFEQFLDQADAIPYRLTAHLHDRRRGRAVAVGINVRAQRLK